MRRQTFLNERRSDLEARINKLPVDQQEVLRLTRDVEVAQQIYVGLLNRTQELEIAKAGTIGNVRIIDDAVVAPNPVEPERRKLTAIAAVLAAFAAAGLVLLRSMFNRGIEVPEQLEQLGLSVYATVPKSQNIGKRQGKNTQESKQSPVDAALARLGISLGTKPRQFRSLLAELDPSDNALEALRGLRTALHFALMESDHKVVAITGASPGVGKTFISCNLAAVYAQAGQRVVVLDTDMRRGHVHTMFKGHRAPGLSEYLAGDIDLEKALQESATSGLSFIARGTVPPNPSELLMGSRYLELIDALRERFDIVIVDTPPVLPVTDGALAGKACDGVFIVAEFGRTSPKDIELTLNRLEASGAKPKGAVLNKIERKASSYYGYYGYYNYQYSYNYRSAEDK
jgi:tyrosine-protein kinase Etk/Wzc